jgi:hypothetical protein
VNVNVKVLPALPYATLAGLTVMTPSPSSAGAAAASNPDVISTASKVIREFREAAFLSWVDRGRSVLAGAGFMAVSFICVFMAVYPLCCRWINPSSGMLS